MQNLVKFSSSDHARIAAIAELVRDCEVIDGEAIYDAIEEAGTPEVDGYDLESWYDNCGDECYAGDWDDSEAHTQEAHELRMAVKEKVFDCIEAHARKLAGA